MIEKQGDVDSLFVQKTDTDREIERRTDSSPVDRVVDSASLDRDVLLFFVDWGVVLCTWMGSTTCLQLVEGNLYLHGLRSEGDRWYSGCKRRDRIDCARLQKQAS